MNTETYRGYVIQAVSYNAARGHPRRNKKWGEWVPAYRIYKEGAPGKLVHEDKAAGHHYESQEEANKTAFTAAKAWIDHEHPLQPIGKNSNAS